MKALVILWTTMFILDLSGQTDSSKSIRLSGLQLKLNLVGTRYTESGREHYQEFVKNNELLNRDVTGYDNNGQSNILNYSSYFGLYAIADLKTKSKVLKPELVFGLNFGQSVISSAYYSKNTYDTVGIYYNAANNESITVVNETNSSYYHQISTAQLLVPIGINITTNKSRRIWITAGLEVSPGIMFSSVFSSQHWLFTAELFLKENSNLKDVRTYVTGHHDMGKSESASTKLNGLGFAVYTTLPLSVNLRLSKRINFLKHLNLTASTSPGFYYSNSKFSGISRGIIVNSALGLRYNY